MKNFDAAIIGAGIVGAACAAALSRDGLRVVVIDGNRPATGTTAAGMGHIVVMDDSPAQLALTKYSQQLWHELANEMPASCEYERCGTIWIAANDEEINEVRQKHELYASNGIATRILDRQSLQDREPNLASDLAGGLLVEGDSVVYQLAATKFMLNKAIGNGATIKTGCGAVSITDGAVSIENGETISCGIVVNAAGAAASELTPELKIKKRKGHLVITERYPAFVRHQLVELGYLKSAHGHDADSVAFNVQPRATGQVLLGSSRQFNAENSGVDHDILTKMAARAFRYMPKLKQLQAVRVWTGFRPATPDNLPYIGKMPGYDNVYAAAGHEGLGITTSLGTAELVAADIFGRTPAIPPAPYLPSRAGAEH